MTTPRQPPVPILALCDAATKGPWHVVKCGTPEMFHYKHGVACIGDHFIETEHEQGHEPSDAQLIARLPPEVMRAVYENAKLIDLNFTRCNACDSNLMFDDEHESWAAAKSIIAILDGQNPEAK